MTDDEQTIRDIVLALKPSGDPDTGYLWELHDEECDDDPCDVCRLLAALDRLVARAETAERRLRDAPLGGDGSHWDGCWRSHIDCAVARVAALEAALQDVHRECHRWWGVTLRPSDFYRSGLEAVDAIARAALAQPAEEEET